MRFFGSTGQNSVVEKILCLKDKEVRQHDNNREERLQGCRVAQPCQWLSVSQVSKDTLLDPLMRSRLVEILLVRMQRMGQMGLVENDDRVKTFFAHRPHPAFRISVS